MSRAMAALPVICGVILLVALWQGLTMLLGVPSYILPRPVAIAGAVCGSLDTLGPALSLTVEESLSGFAAGAAIGLGLAVLMVLLPPVEAVLMPVVVALNMVPSVAFVPLALIWFGLGPVSKIAMAALAVNFVVLLNALGGLRQPDAEAVNLLRSYGAGPLGILWRLRLPTAMPAIVTGLRTGLTRSTIAVIVAEMLGAYAGIGQLIYQSVAQVDYLTVWAAVTVVSIASLVLYGMLVVIDRKLIWWR